MQFLIYPLDGAGNEKVYYVLNIGKKIKKVTQHLAFLEKAYRL